ncbi:MAG: hypothetical protein FWF84_07325, partial [Kiritimatiellaeota bacterium]|nr:hypothetical protein [Kiritimatiellota bacterium]
NVRGTGLHLGNPNMAINRYMGVPSYAVMIQDHPKAAAWLDEANRYTRWKISHNTTSGGGTFRENPGYATYGPSIFIATAAIALKHAGYDIDRFEPLKEWARYFTDIETAKARPQGVYRGDHREWLGGALRDAEDPQSGWIPARKLRFLPGFGDGGDVAGAQTQYLWANLFAESDPAFASAMLNGWEEGGSYFGTEQTYPGFWYYWKPDLKSAPVRREDTIIAGFGGILRAHTDSPDETYVCLRQGYTQSHWGTDQGDFVLFARGVCLAPATGFGYIPMAEGVYRHSLINFGGPLISHDHGRVDTNIEDYGSTPAVGYLHGRKTFPKRWDALRRVGDYLETQGISRHDAAGLLKYWDEFTPQANDDFDHSRQVMLLRSEKVNGANYVVMRDSVQGECNLPSWWHQWLMASAENVTPVKGGALVRAGEGVVMDVRVVEPAGATLGIVPIKVPGFAEDYCQLSLENVESRTQNVEKELYLTVFYPRLEKEQGIKSVEKLADGVLKIVTPESTDYVFMGVDKPITFKNKELDINAFAGAVRVFKDKALIINASGQFGTIAYKGATVEGIGPFEVPAKASKIVTKAGRKLTPVSIPNDDKAYYMDDRLKTGRIWSIIDGFPPQIMCEGLQGYAAIDGDKVTFAMTQGNGKISYKDFYVKGEAPFTCVWEPGKITLTAEGRRRIFQMPIPENIVPANLLPPKETLPSDFRLNWAIGGWINWPWSVNADVDGIPRQVGWYDGKMTVGFDDGAHTAVITPFTNPPVWPVNRWTKQLSFGK